MKDNGYTTPKGYSMPKTSQKRLQWERATQRNYGIKLSRLSEADLINWLEDHKPYQGYIKELIRKDMASNK